MAEPKKQVEQPKKPPKKREKFGDKKIVAVRSPRAGDQGYELNCVESQVTLIFEDGSEQVVKASDQYEPED